MVHVRSTKAKEVRVTKIRADRRLIMPRGISRTLLVRGFAVSISASKNRLNAMAADLARIIAPTICAKSNQDQPICVSRNPSIIPNSAKGIAKMVWLNLISDK